MTEKADEAPSDQALADLLKLPVQLVQMMRKSDQPATSVVAQEKPVQPEAAQAAQAEPPLAKGLEDWWQKELTAADAAAREKEAKAAGERAANRFWHVVHFGKDPGGWAQPSGGGRQIDWTKMPPGRDVWGFR